MLLSTPRSIPTASNVILKRSAKKFFDLAQGQGWIVRVHMDNYERVSIEAWDFDRATDPEARSGQTVRVRGMFNAYSGAYISHAYGELVAGRTRCIIGGSTWDEKLQNALDKLEHGPKWRMASEAAAAKRKAEKEAQRLRHEALKASVLAAGDSVLGKEVRDRLHGMTIVKDVPDLGTSPMRFEENLAAWRRSQRTAVHAREARKLIHQIATRSDGTEACLTPEEAAVKQAEIVWIAMVTNIADGYSLASTHNLKADANFIRAFHPKFNPQFVHVRVIHS
jgi:hypothetical protein